MRFLSAHASRIRENPRFSPIISFLELVLTSQVLNHSIYRYIGVPKHPAGETIYKANNDLTDLGMFDTISDLAQSIGHSEMFSLSYHGDICMFILRQGHPLASPPRLRRPPRRGEGNLSNRRALM